MHVVCNVAMLTLILTIASMHVGNAASPMCFDCRNIPFPRDCDNVMQCGADSKCYTEQVVTPSGVVLYNTGCRSTIRCGMARRTVVADEENKVGLADNASYNVDVVMEQSDNIFACEQCCDGDYCNSQGCGSKALPPRTNRGPVCFNCHQQGSHNTCYSVKVCDVNEKCSLRSYVSGTSDRIFSSECLPAKKCNQVGGTYTQSAIVGRRDSVNCHGCCDTDFCNSDCSALQNPNSTSQIQASTQTTQAPLITSNPNSTKSITNTVTSTVTSTTVPTSTSTRSSTKTRPTTVPTTIKHTQPSSTDTPSTSTLQSTTSVTMSLESLCQSKYYTFDQTDRVCYKIYHDIKRSWSQARQQCQNDGGDLIIFSSRNEESHFSSLVGKLRDKLTYWVGASDIQKEGAWQWVDGSSVDGSLFIRGQPDNRTGEDCAALTHLSHFYSLFALSPTKLNDGVCTLPEHFICEIKSQSSPSLKPIQTHCRNPDYQYNAATGICFKVYNQLQLPQLQARQTCLSENADLLILRNRTVEQVFQDMDFYDHDFNHRYWLGAFRKPGYTANSYTSFQWFNGRELDPFLQWHSGEPNNWQLSESCVTFTYYPLRYGRGYEDFTLNDASCPTPYRFICEEKCPDRTYYYHQQLGLCFKVYNDLVNWDEAKGRCSQDNADLLEIKDNIELLYFQAYLRSKVYGTYWIGAREYTNTGMFHWQTMQTYIPANFWHTGQPPLLHDGKECGALSYQPPDYTVAMVNQNCNQDNHAFICSHIW